MRNIYVMVCGVNNVYCSVDVCKLYGIPLSDPYHQPLYTSSPLNHYRHIIIAYRLAKGLYENMRGGLSCPSRLKKCKTNEMR